MTIREELKGRFVERTYTGIDCGEGWDDILAMLHARLLQTDPDYRLVQIKEKFANLRWYTSGILSDEGERAVVLAERLSSVTCEVCGSFGKTRGKGWIRTLCDDHAKDDE